MVNHGKDIELDPEVESKDIGYPGESGIKQIEPLEPQDMSVEENREILKSMD